MDCAQSPLVHLTPASARLNQWAAVLLSLVALTASFSAIATETKHVLFLHSFGPEIAPFQEIVDALRTELVQDSSAPVAIHDASIEEGRATELHDAQSLLEMLRHSFGGSPPDLVVTIGAPAATFYVQYRDQIFPKTPAVFGALDELWAPKSALRTGDSVVAARVPHTMLVESILQVLPDTQKIAVVIGDSPLERWWVTELQKQFARFGNRVAFEWLNDLSFKQVRERIAVLPEHSAVLYLSLITDVAGVPHHQIAGLTNLVGVSAAPIFSYYESEFGKGVVGGPYISEHQHGARIAAAALRALLGKPSATPTIELTGYEAPVYDWRALRRWGIDPARLPAGSEIRFRPPSLWDEHRALIIATIAIFTLQAVLLIGLVSQRVRRRRAEEEAQALSGRLIDAHEDERRWLARELHDDITQRLAGLAIAAAKLPESDSLLTARDARRVIREGLSQLSEDVHNLSYRLHPSVLDDLGLVEALKAECERVARVECVRVEVRAETLPQTVSKEAALGVYRVAQEALSNIVRHAKANMVQIVLALTDGGLRLAVTDDGIGFEPDLQSLRARPSLGHASMRERIRFLGGQLDIRSTPGGGTTVVAWVPIPKAAA